MVVMAKNCDKDVIKGSEIKKQYIDTENNVKFKSTFNIYHVITIAILASLFSLIMGIVISSSDFANKKSEYPETITNFIDEYLAIKDDYYDDIDDKESMKTALEAIVNSLDSYSTIVDDSLSNTLSTKLQGTYQGFGIEIVNDADKNIIVAGIVDDSPAQVAGLKILDVIKKIDDKNTTGLTTTEFVSLVKESTKTSFVLTIDRDGQEMEIKLERKMVTLKSVATDIYERNNKKIGYIYINLFAYNTDVQFSEALDDLESKNIDSLIVDLRYNTGGHLTAVENMISEFLNKKHVIYQIQSKNETKKYYSKTNEKRDYNVVVLVNGYSASASEMFAAAMQEEYGATIIGTTTFGKGTVQEVQDSSLTGKQYKLTTKKWLTPKGNWINEVGIKPDIVVELDVKDQTNFTDQEDNQLQTAINELAK